MNKFYVFKVGNKFVYITKDLKLGLTNLNRCAYWRSKSELKTWSRWVKEAYSNSEIKEVRFKLV